MEKLNFLSIFITSFIPFMLGSIWYSPKVFGNVWKEEVKSRGLNTKYTHTTRVYFISWVLSLITIIAFALYVGEKPSINSAVIQGLYVGGLFVATSFGINY